VSTEEGDGDGSERPAGDLLGVVDQRGEGSLIGGRRSAGPLPGDRGPEGAVDLTSSFEDVPPTCHEADRLPVECVELVDDDLALPVDPVTLGGGEPGVHPGQPPLVVLEPPGGWWERAVGSGVHRAPPRVSVCRWVPVRHD